MAKSVLPNPLVRRHLLERQISAAHALGIAEAYLGDGRRGEALAFLVKAEARDRIEQVREEAVAGGDAFLLREASRALAEDPGAERWRRLAEAAAAAGKERYATEARRQAERREA